MFELMDWLVQGGKRVRLGELLINAGAITEEQLQQALTAQKSAKKGTRIGTVLQDLGIVSEQDIISALKSQIGVESVDLSSVQIPHELLGIVDEKILRKYSIIPFAVDPNDELMLYLAMSDPLDIYACDDITIMTGYRVHPFVTTMADISAAIDRYYGSSEAMRVAEQYRQERESRRKETGKEKEAEEGDDKVNSSPIVKLANTIIEQAVHMRTSDIHIEPTETRVRVRFRVDGVLHEIMSYDISVMPALVARLKIVSGMDISEKRKPQDGRTSVVVDKVDFDIRVSMLPTIYGEKVVMRLIRKKALLLDKRQLGFPDRELHVFEDIISHPNGMLLVTGPTGSGKSTTLYTALSELNTEFVNIITVEDPVEANLDGLNQVQINEKAGLTFAAALRSILRQDPDIIMIGEIRDQETAGIAVKAAITGHLVVSTLHTNSAANTITRLEDMGTEKYMIGDAVIGIIAQRLVRRICESCSTDAIANEEEKKILGMSNYTQPIPIKRPGKCECVKCGGTGYKGRIGIYEIMPMTTKLRAAINKDASADELEQIAIADGMKTIRMSAVEYCLQGITTVDEVARVAFESEEE